MTHWKKLLVSGACAAGMLMLPGAAAAAGNGFVNYAAVLQESPEFAQAQREMVSAQQALQQQFDTRSENMNDRQKQELLAKLQKDLQMRQEAIQRSKVVPALQKIQAAIEAAAKKNGIDFVVQESAWLYGGKDLTQEVIDRLK
ncbi:MAG: OmpH family outer membrane protein [Veillonellaceae bacterium]|nr:OmpH family outer membrane protein [Veillonellaceae bacterium]